MSVQRAERGFTLIEALVAVTLLALIAGALMPLFQQGISVLQRGDERTRATLLAASVLEEHVARALAMTADLVETEASGDEGEFSWQLTRAPYDLSSDGGPPLDSEDPTFELVRLIAQVQWPGGGEGVRLSTLVLEPLQ